ncbi:hypothetical protein [Sinomonas halotolerans]|uniref:DNA-binding protein n=1 Tax=Sinomonas halotolerans TaxID=1644133 RepID=A0ABU9X4A0_9MICC
MADTAPLLAASLADLPERGFVAGSGVVRSITYVPVTDSPQVSALVSDDDAEHRAGASVSLVWLGRRRVSGLGAGTRLRFTGMVARQHGVPTIFNPRYEILAKED